MKRLLWLLLALVSAVLNPVAALAQDGAALRPVPVALNGADEMKLKGDLCRYGFVASETRKFSGDERLAACREAYVGFGGSAFHRNDMAMSLCVDRKKTGTFQIAAQDRDLCYNAAVDTFAVTLTEPLSVHSQLLDALPALCDAGHYKSCVLFARISMLRPKEFASPLSAADAAAMLERACTAKTRTACYYAAQIAFKAKDWARTGTFLRQECALGNKDVCDEITRLGSRGDAGFEFARGMYKSDIELFDEACWRDEDRSSCFIVARYKQRLKELDIPTARRACFTGDAGFCEDLAKQEAFEGDLGKVDDALYRGCRLDIDLCDELVNYRSGKLVYERSPDFLPPDPQYIAARLVESRAARDASGKPAATFFEIMLCDIGDLSACKELGMKVPRDTPSFTMPPINEFVSKVQAKADEKCGQKREADFCRELAIVLRPGFKGEQAIDMPRAARFGAAACMLGKIDMCGFSGVALVEGQHGGPPDRKNGGALLNKGCSGRDAAACYFFATVLAQDGRFDQAKLAAQTALQINPAFAEAKDLLAKLNQEP